MTLQSEVIKQLGGFGKYQRRLCALLCCVSVVVSSFTMTTLFVAYVPPHRCRVHELETLNSDFEVPVAHSNVTENSTVSVVNAYIPLRLLQDGHYQWEQCNRFNTSTRSYNESKESVVSCNEGWSYLVKPNEVSAVMEFDLVCEKSWIVPLIPSMLLAGIMFGAIVGGYLSDRYGRKRTLLLSFGIVITGALGMAWTPVVAGVHVGIFLQGMGLIMRSTIAVVMINESTTRKVGKKLSLIVIMCSSIGNSVTSGVAYLITHWRWMLTAMAILALLIVPFVVLFIEESIIWLLQIKKTTLSERVMRNIAKINGVNGESAITLISGPDSEETKSSKTEVQDDDKKPSAKLSFIHLFKVGFLRTRMLILTLALFTISVVFYGLAFNANRLAGDRYLNCFLVNIADLAGYIVWFVVVRKLGCRRVFVCSTLICGLLLLSIPLLHSVDENAERICAMIGKCFIGGSFLMLYLFTGDFFPTLLRNQAYGVSSFFARIGGILVPYILYLGDVVHFSIPYVFMGTCCVLAAVAVFFLPETMDLDMPVTLDDAEELEKYRPKLICFTKGKEDANKNSTATAVL